MKYINTSLASQKLFKPEDGAKWESLYQNRTWGEFSSLNLRLRQTFPRSGLSSLYRISVGNFRLVAVRTTKNNLLPVCIFEPKANQHSSQKHWDKHIHKSLTILLELLQDNQALFNPDTIEITSGIEASTEEETIASPKALSRTVDRVNILAQEINSAVCHGEQQKLIMKLATMVHKRAQLVFDGHHFTYFNKSETLSTDFKIKLIDAEKTLDFLADDIASGNITLLPTLFGLAMLCEKLVNKYLRMFFEQHTILLQDLINKNNCVSLMPVILAKWQLFNSITKRNILSVGCELPLVADTLIAESGVIIKDVLQSKELLAVFLKGYAFTYYKRCVNAIQYRYLEQHITYLEKHLAELRCEKAVSGILQQKLAPSIHSLPTALQTVLGMSSALVLTQHRKQRYKKQVLTPQARQKHYTLFSLKDWVCAFECGLGKAEFISLMEHYGIELSIMPEPDFDEFLSLHAPDGYREKRVKDEQSFAPSLVAKILSEANNIDILRRIFSHFSHLGLIDHPQVKVDLYYLCISGDMDLDSVELILQMFPQIREHVIGPVSLLRAMINVAHPSLLTTHPVLYKENSKKLEIAMQYCEVTNERDQDQLLGSFSGILGKTVCISFTQSYLQAVECARFDIALKLIKQTSSDLIKSAPVWFHGNIITHLNVLEILEVFTFCGIQIFIQKQKSGDDLSKYKEAIEDLAIKVYVQNATQEGLEVMIAFNEEYTPEGVIDFLHEEIGRLEGSREKRVQSDLLKSLLPGITMNHQAIGFSYQSYLDLTSYCRALGMKVSMSKLNLLRRLYSNRSSSVLTVFSDPEFENICLETMVREYGNSKYLLTSIPKGITNFWGIGLETRSAIESMKVTDPLVLASAVGFENVVDYFIYELKVPINVYKGFTAIHVAIFEGHDKIIKMLVEYDSAWTSLVEYSSMVINWVTKNIAGLNLHKRHVAALKNLPALSTKVANFKAFSRAVITRSIECSQQKEARTVGGLVA